MKNLIFKPFPYDKILLRQPADQDDTSARKSWKLKTFLDLGHWHFGIVWNLMLAIYDFNNAVDNFSVL